MWLIEYFMQLLVLTRKNLVINLRNWKTIVFVIISPILIVAALHLLTSALLNSIESLIGDLGKATHYPKPHPIPKLPQCRGFGARKCVSIRFSPPEAQPLIDIILADNGLKKNDFFAHESIDALRDYVLHHPNTTMIGLSFDYEVLSSSMVNYTIFFNDSSVSTDPYTSVSAPDLIPSVQLSVENAILKHRMQKLLDKAVSHLPSSIGERLMDVTLRDMPRPPLINATEAPPLTMFEGIMNLSLSGFLLQFSLVMFWIVLLYYMVWEKTLNLRFAMTVMGMRNASWWHSWFLVGLCQMFISVLAVYFTGLAFKMNIFRYTNPIVILIIFCTYGVSLLGVAMLISVFSTSNKMALLVAFILNGVSFFTGLITNNGLFVYALYAFKPGIMHGLSWFPPFNFGKCISDLITVTYGLSLSGPTDTYFSWKHFGQEMHSLFGKAPPTFHNVLFMWATNIVLFIIVWYLDHVLPSNMNGQPQPFYFFLLPSFWGLRTNKTSALHVINYLLSAKHKAEQLASDETDARVADHILKAVEQEESESESDVFRVVQLEKSYHSFRKAPVKAVKNVSIKAQKGMCLALLGHNGAGKSTIISTIIGQNSVDEGTCFVFGRDVRNDMSQIRRDIGVCMQDDFLNPYLTAWEHLRLFAQFKDVADKNQEVIQRLKDVGLYDVRNKQTRTFSGGMKRRLSCAIALIGSPSMVILDEPTTGLDVQSKRLIWKLVHEMKKDKLVLLTTHAMEEADKLGDLISIMAFGKIKCIGNSLQLKNQFGSGFNIQVTANIVHNNDNNEEIMHQQLWQKMNIIKNVIKKFAPQAEEVSMQANSLLYKLPSVTMKDLIPLVQEIEGMSISKLGEEEATVKNFHLSHSTLEEVYLSVTKQANFGVTTDQYHQQQMQQ